MFSTIVFTVCTANYLAQAKAMADSVKKYNNNKKEKKLFFDFFKNFFITNEIKSNI